MKTSYLIISLFAVLAISIAPSADAKVWFDGSNPVTFTLSSGYDPVVRSAATLFSNDMKEVTGSQALESKKNGAIKIVQLNKASSGELRNLKKIGVPVDSLSMLTDGFDIRVADGKIRVTGANGRGTAYGLLELSRIAGVSPWIWWGDIVPERKEKLEIPDDFTLTQGASVEYRGVFLNDEDWSLRPWSGRNYEKGREGEIGPETYRKVFELLLRLRGNAIWPAMHEGTKAFFLTDNAKNIADSFGIAIGSSHCEPLLRNNVGEWDRSERGDFNYRTNREGVQQYWIERLKEVKGSSGGNLFTIGMRGIHDSSMEGYKTPQEKFDGLQQVINDQQELIEKYIGDPAKQTQVFVPYKEVLEIYEKGLNVPDYVTLMWCDDNYGYLTRLSNPLEQKRSGGGGVYYHLSYWGRPHDYLWLCTTQPGLIFNEMKEAYDHNVRKIWIVNIHDPKVAGYNLELFLDLAWDIDCVDNESVGTHYKNWLKRQFGDEAGELIYPAMYEFYRQTGQRRPEFMGWSQVELDKRLYDRGLSPIRVSEFNMKEFGNELDRYLENYACISQRIAEGAEIVRPELRDGYFAAIEYPVYASESHAIKILESQKANSFMPGINYEAGIADTSKVSTAITRSISAANKLNELTKRYNTLQNGKWNGLMDMRPRNLPVFSTPPLPKYTSLNISDSEITPSTPTTSHPLKTEGVIAVNACNYSEATPGARKISMLGHSMNALALPENGVASYDFMTPEDGNYILRVALIPTQPNDGGDVRFSVSVDGGEPEIFSIKEPFRSEQWKLNVMRGQAVKTLPVSLAAGRHTLAIKALDSHIAVDQWMLDPNPSRKFYLFPAGQ